MLDKIGLVGAAGVVLLFAGIAAVATENVVVAAGLLATIAGLLLLLKGVVDSALEAMGMKGAL